MQSKTKQLQMLLEEWNKRLKDSGFKDIESDDLKTGQRRLNQWDSQYFYLRNDPDLFSIKADYYYRATQFLHEFRFRTNTDRHIWQMHSEGHGVRIIAKSLENLGIRLNKDYVARIVTRLKQAMAKRATCKSENLSESDLD